MTRRNATSSACTNGDAMSYDVENRMTSMTTASGTEAWFHKVGQTVDANITWTIMNANYGPNDIARDPVWEDRLFAANNNGDPNNAGVGISMDGGVTWTHAPIGWTASISVVPR